MATGLKIWDQYGNLVLDGTKRAGRVIGITQLTAGANGSVSDARFSQGQPFVAHQRDILFHTTSGNGGIRAPQFSFSGNTLTWTYPAQNNSADETVAGLIVYGVF